MYKKAISPMGLPEAKDEWLMDGTLVPLYGLDFWHDASKTASENWGIAIDGNFVAYRYLKSTRYAYGG